MTPRAWATEGIILKRKNVGEADRIVTMLTRNHGKVRLIAKGVRKIKSRRGGHLEVFSKVKLMIHTGHSMDSVGEVSSIETYQGIRSDLPSVSAAYFLCELVDTLTAEKQEHADVFVLLSDALSAISVNKAGLYKTTREFALNLLWTLGFLPRTKKLQGRTLEAFIESITEKELRTPQFVRRMV